MEYIYIGRIITTHGLKGEIKIRSNFQYKEKVFKKDFKFYIGKEKEEHIVLSYRPHKDYDMVILSNIDDIDKAIKYKQELVFINKDDLKLNNEYLNEDLIGLKAIYKSKEIGIVKSITNEGNNNIVIRLDNNKIIPKDDNFIDNIDFNKKEIIFKNLEGLL